MSHQDAGLLASKADTSEGCIPPTSIIACCITGLNPEYTSSAKIHTRLIQMVTKGGCDRFSDQGVTIPWLT
jgi:hypothetical protein